MKALDRMPAAPLNARIQATVAPHSICGGSSLRPTLSKTKRTLRAGNRPTIVQGSSRAPATVDTPPPGDIFHNRVTEMDYFKEMFKEEVGFVTVLVGPRNCGKSRLLNELEQQYEAEKIGPLFLYIDSRRTPVRSPEAISKALSNALQIGKLARLANYTRKATSLFSSLSINAGLFTISLKEVVPKLFRRDEVNLEPTINKYDKILTALKPLPRKPVIVIDEANNLMDWKESDSLQPELQRFLNFLVSISKQERLAHVVLATSDYFLANWLSQVGMTEDKFAVQVVGDLTEEEAQRFLYGDGLAGGWSGIVYDSPEIKKVPSGAEGKWPSIYERCGGNIGLLKQCVAAARVWENWDDALQTVVAGPLEAVVRGLEPEVYIKKGGEAPLWTKDQWKRVLESITTAPHHAVSVSTIKEELENAGEGNGSNILLSMVKYNLLALRPFSTLARDLPREVHGNDMEKVVTLPLPAHVWAAKVVLRSLRSRKAQGSDLKSSKKDV